MSEGPWAHVLVRIWLPDRPGALGLVASRIGALRGDIVGVDVLERDGGVAIDEFAVNLPSTDLLAMLIREIEEVDGTSVEEVRQVSHFPDPRLDALESATRLCQTGAPGELHQALVAQVCDEFLAEWAALITATSPDIPAKILAAAGSPTPDPKMLTALAVGMAASPLVVSGAAGPEDLAAAPLTGHAATLMVSRSGYPFRLRERGQLIALARIADRLWDLLAA